MFTPQSNTDKDSKEHLIKRIRELVEINRELAKAYYMGDIAPDMITAIKGKLAVISNELEEHENT